MTVAIYGTIWIALALFAAGEAGKRGLHGGGAPTRWAWWAYGLGAAIAVAHVIVAMDVQHGWSHASAVRETARQTAAIYGVDWGGGVYVNYVFVGVWVFEAWQWRRSPTRYASRSPAATWCLRAFYLIIIANAAIVFSTGVRRFAGALVVASLIISWWPTRRWRPKGTGE